MLTFTAFPAVSMLILLWTQPSLRSKELGRAADRAPSGSVGLRQQLITEMLQVRAQLLPITLHRAIDPGNQRNGQFAAQLQSVRDTHRGIRPEPLRDIGLLEAADKLANA